MTGHCKSHYIKIDKFTFPQLLKVCLKVLFKIRPNSSVFTLWWHKLVKHTLVMQIANFSQGSARIFMYDYIVCTIWPSSSLAISCHEIKTLQLVIRHVVNCNILPRRSLIS